MSSLFSKDDAKCITLDLKTILYKENWREIFLEPETRLGNRLGIDYLRACTESISIEYKENILNFSQNSTEELGGVIWDTGLLMTDFLIEFANEMLLNKSCLEIGCGTGVRL